MPAAVLVIATLLAQGQGTLSRADSLLTAGDTAAAIEELGTRIEGESDEVALAAALTLDGIGRGQRWPETAEHLADARSRPWRQTSHLASLLEIARALRTGRGRGWDAGEVGTVRGILDSAPTPSLLHGATAWVLTQQLLGRFEATLVDALPSVSERRGCPVERATVCVRVAGTADGRGLPLQEIVGRDAGLAALRREVGELLVAQLHAPWPFPDLPLQELFAVEVLFGDPLDARTEALGELPDLDPAILWRLAWALYLEPVNERQVVHRARVLASGPIARTLPRVGKMLWLESDSSLLIRYGVPRGMARREGGLRPTGGGMPVVTHVDRRARETLLRTTGVVAVSPVGVTGPNALAPDLGLAARDTVALSGPSGYVDDHFDVIGQLEHQLVQYFRDGQPFIEVYVTRPEAHCDTPGKARRKIQQLSGDGPRPVMGFFLLDSRLGLVRRAVDSVAPGAPSRYTYQFKPEPGVYVYSLEHYDPACRQAARARYVTSVRRLERGMSLSDIVLSADRRVDGTIRVAGPPRPSALGRLTVSVREPLHLYWEVYAVPADSVETDRFDVAVELLDLGSRKVAVRQVPDVARAVEDSPRSLNMRYRAPIVMGDRPLAMGLSIDLPPGSEGLHLVRIHVKDVRTGQSASAQRALFVAP